VLQRQRQYRQRRRREARWSTDWTCRHLGHARRHERRYAPLTSKGAGGSVDFVDLPDLGIKGNLHMMMINKNSDQIAGLIGTWLLSKG